MTAKEEKTILSDKEKDIVQRCADLLGISFEDAVNKLFADGLSNRSKKRLGKKPSSVRRFK